MNNNDSKQSWKPKCGATLVGSMPHTNRKQIINLILEKLADIPVWPQLPKYHNEGMMVQYLEGLPGVVQKNDQHIIDTESSNFDVDVQTFYEQYLDILEAPEKAKENSYFSFGTRTGETFYVFLEVLRTLGRQYKAIKGQVTGPFTLLSALKDQNGKLILYDERMQDIIPKHLAMKALWQAKQLEDFADNVIIFFDEPALAGYGSSAFISISEKFVSKLLEEICNILKLFGYYVGVHVCANTDWSLLLKSGIDIVNFDAYNFGEKFVLYKSDVRKFIEKGGIIAWGVVPTDSHDKIIQETPDKLLKLLDDLIGKIINEKINKTYILDHSIITPSCGCGTLSEKDAEIVLNLLVNISNMIKNKIIE